MTELDESFDFIERRGQTAGQYSDFEVILEKDFFIT
jgi:hypothetical protein